MNKIIVAGVIGITLLSTIAVPALAQQPRSVPSAGNTVLATGIGGGLGLIKTLTNWLFTLLLVMAVLFIIVAAYKYLFSGGGEEVGQAHNMLIYAAVAVAVAFLARGIIFVVEELVTSGNAGGSGSSGNGGINWNVGSNGNGGINWNVGSGDSSGY